MHKNATKCNETLDKWCKDKHVASKIMDTLETYQLAPTILVKYSQNDYHKPIGPSIHMFPLICRKEVEPHVNLVGSSVDNLQKVWNNILSAIPNFPN
jgi:hypothetical protein